MTAISQPRTISLEGRDRSRPIREIVAALARTAGSLRDRVRDAASSGQLGPDRETEIGRWTGARI